MGHPKAMLPYGDGCFLTVILAKLSQSGFGRPIVVLGREAVRIRTVLNPGSAQVVINLDPSRGQSSSIQAGLQEIEGNAEGALIWPVDLPAIGALTALEVALRFLSGNALIAVPVCSGRRGHPVIFRRSIFAELLDLKPGEPARGVVQRHLASTETIDVRDSSILEDIDTPEEYLKLTGVTIENALRASTKNK
jgi:molybdenum cofactor cytidylyltransferase